MQLYLFKIQVKFMQEMFSSDRRTRIRRPETNIVSEWVLNQEELLIDQELFLVPGSRTKIGSNDIEFFVAWIGRPWIVKRLDWVITPVTGVELLSVISLRYPVCLDTAYHMHKINAPFAHEQLFHWLTWFMPSDKLLYTTVLSSEILSTEYWKHNFEGTMSYVRGDFDVKEVLWNV